MKKDVSFSSNIFSRCRPFIILYPTIYLRVLIASFLLQWVLHISRYQLMLSFCLEPRLFRVPKSYALYHGKIFQEQEALD